MNSETDRAVRSDTTLRNRVAITGIGESEYAEGGGNSVQRLTLDACRRAIADAGLEADEVDGVVIEGELMPETLPPDELAGTLGLDLNYAAESLAVGAGTTAAPLLAAQAIEHGLAEHVICYFGVDWATKRDELGAYEGSPYSYHTRNPLKADLEIPFGWVTQPVYLAAHARRHAFEFGTTERQFGEVAIQTRENAVGNPTAQRSEPITMDDYLDNPVIADPFRILDCCLISDGAAAFVLSAAEDAERGPEPPVYVRGVGTGFDSTTDTEFMTQHREFTSLPSTESGPRAFEMAGIEPEDTDFAELYDCFTVTTLMQLEDLGFCKKGDGGRFVEEEGITVADGTLPVNTHGGLLSHSYTLGVGHVIEAVKQLRGTAVNQVEDARLGVVAGWGESEHSTLVLEGGR
ncbi:MAG: thiolase family protein [Halapricum sp.]